MKTIFLLSTILVMACSCGGWTQRKKPHTENNRALIKGPIDINDLNNYFKIGMSRDEVLEICGTPVFKNTQNNIEELEFLVAFENFELVSDWTIISFIVVLEDEKVISWRENASGRIR